MNAGVDPGIRSTTTGCVALLALIAGTVSYLHMHVLVELNGQPGLLDDFHHADTQTFARSPVPARVNASRCTALLKHERRRAPARRRS